MCLMLLAVLLALLSISLSQDQPPIALMGTHQLIPSPKPLLDPTAIELVYQAPPGGKPKGVIFLAHGCSHSGTDWWPHSDTCPWCIGLPVERSIVAEALRRGYVAMALSSANRKHKCWGDGDISRAATALRWVLHKHGLLLRTTHVHLLGASSGGSFVGHMALKSCNLSIGGETNPFEGMGIASAVIQISPLRLVIKSKKDGKKRMPGLLFMHMARDTSLAPTISAIVSQADSPSVREMLLAPKALSPTFFSDHGHLGVADSAKLVEALAAASYLRDGLLVDDPRGSDWRNVAAKALPGVVPTLDSLTADESGISELLNMAYAQHEMSNERLADVFAFMQSMEAPFSA